MHNLQDIHTFMDQVYVLDRTSIDHTLFISEFFSWLQLIESKCTAFSHDLASQESIEERMRELADSAVDEVSSDGEDPVVASGFWFGSV